MEAPTHPPMPQADAEFDLLIATRRDLHRHPELGYEEKRTARIVAQRLRESGWSVQEGVAETGVVGTLTGGAGDGPTLLLRADMDALPIQEEADHDFVSVHPGRMHACGHDAHVAIGLAVADRLARRRGEWSGTVRYLFQPAEEGGGGALRMVQEGALEGVDAALGLHVWMQLDSGTVGVVEGPMMAGSREFRITVRGRGGHGAIPHETIDAVMIASQIVVAAIVLATRVPTTSNTEGIGELDADRSYVMGPGGRIQFEGSAGDLEQSRDFRLNYLRLAGDANGGGGGGMNPDTGMNGGGA